MAKIMIGSMQGTDFFSKLIKWWQFGQPETHVFAVSPDLAEHPRNPKILEAWIRPLFSGQVRSIRLRDAHRGYFTLYEVEVTYEQAEKFYEYLESKVGKHGYDYLGLVGLVLHRIRDNDKKRYFCSEILYESFNHIGVKLLNNVPPERVTPAMLLMSPKVKIVGNI